MNANIKQALWEQFGAAIDTLENAMHACPDDLWFDHTTNYPEYWATVHHTLFWLDYYLTDPDEKFTPPPPIGLEELDPTGVLPEKPYSKDEMQTYLEYGRRKCRTTIEALTDEKAYRVIKFGKVDLSFASLILYNLRHVQHHAAQLNQILRQTIDSAPGWVFKARDDD